MKFSSVASLVAILCATAVLGAPAPEINLQNFQLSSDVTQKLQASLECVHNVVSEVTKDNEVGVWLGEVKGKIFALYSSDWMKCLEIEDLNEQETCKVTIVKNGAEIVGEVFAKLIKESKMDELKELNRKVVAKCFDPSTLTDILGQINQQLHGVDVWSTLPDLVSQAIDAIENISVDNGFEELWSQNEPKIDEHLQKWEECVKQEDQSLVAKCHTTDGLATIKLIIEYIRSAFVQNQDAVIKIVKEIPASLGRQTFGETLKDHMVENAFAVSKKAKCIADTITDVVKGTEHAQLWKEHELSLDRLFERLQIWKNDIWINAFYASQHVGSEISAIHQEFSKFAASLKKVDNEAYLQIKEYIKEKCH